MTEEKITVFSEKENDREPYTSPEICVYGALEKLTQRPSGSPPEAWRDRLRRTQILK